MPAVRGDGDHAAAAALDHRREEGVGEGDDRLAVDADHLGLALGIELEEAAAEAEAGVVDQQVDVDAELGDLAGQLRRLGSRGRTRSRGPWSGARSASCSSRSLRRATRIRS